MIYNNILDAIGNTPIIKLQRMTGPDDKRLKTGELEGRGKRITWSRQQGAGDQL